MIYASKHPEATEREFEGNYFHRPAWSQVNAPNPFLAAARKAIAEGATYRDLSDDLDGYQVGYPGCEHIEDAFAAGYRTSAPDHARRVLSRLAALS